MKNRLILPLLALSLSACNLNNPEANRIVGTWIVEDAVGSPGSLSKIYPATLPGKGAKITFTKKGELKGSYRFSGGWCNQAETYRVGNDTLYMEFGKPGCIPFINPQISDRAAILTLDRKMLKIRYGGYDIALNRK